MLDIYKSFYNFKEQPFRLSPDYRFCYNHPSYTNAKSYLKYAISEGEGFVVITGEPGTGKTTLITSLLSELDNMRVQIATLTNVQIDAANLLHTVLEEFLLPLNSRNQSSPISILKHHLIQQSKNGRRCILIVDEAQGLSTTSLEELRLISNLQHNNRLLLQVFLVGQEPLMDIIRAPGLEQLHQRLIAASHLESLGQSQTRAYIEHRLHKAGWENDPAFAKEAMNIIYKFSGGIPRRINLICHRLFLYGGLSRKHELSGADAMHVIVELHREGLLFPKTNMKHDEYIDSAKPCAISSNNR